MADVGVFGRYKGFSDFQEAAKANNLKEALVGAQIQGAMAKAALAQQPNLKKLGESGFLKAAQGIDPSPDEAAGMRYLDAGTGGMMFDPVTGNASQKPSLLDKIPFPNQAVTKQPTPQTRQDSEFAQVMNGLGGVPGSGDFITDMSPDANGVVTMPTQDDAADFGAPLPPVSNPIAAPNTGNAKLDQKIKEEKAKLEINRPQKIFENENKLRDEFNTQTKDFRTIQDAFSRVNNLSDTPQGDIALLFATAKLNDPTSVVRESEFATQASAGSFGDRMANLVNQVTTGNRLTAQQRQNLIAESKNIYDSQKVGYDKTLQNYRDIAKRGGLDAKNIITDYAVPVKMSPLAQKGKAAFDAKKGFKTTPNGVQYRIIK